MPLTKPCRIQQHGYKQSGAANAWWPLWNIVLVYVCVQYRIHWHVFHANGAPVWTCTHTCVHATYIHVYMHSHTPRRVSALAHKVSHQYVCMYVIQCFNLHVSLLCYAVLYSAVMYYTVLCAALLCLLCRWALHSCDTHVFVLQIYTKKRLLKNEKWSKCMTRSVEDPSVVPWTLAAQYTQANQLDSGWEKEKADLLHASVWVCINNGKCKSKRKKAFVSHTVLSLISQFFFPPSSSSCFLLSILGVCSAFQNASCVRMRILLYSILLCGVVYFQKKPIQHNHHPTNSMEIKRNTPNERWRRCERKWRRNFHTFSLLARCKYAYYIMT